MHHTLSLIHHQNFYHGTHPTYHLEGNPWSYGKKLSQLSSHLNKLKGRETELLVKHLFFQCRFARSIWSIIQVASSLYPPTSVANVFGNWLHGIDLKSRMLISVVALAIMWTLWLCRNDKIFNDKNCSLLQVIYKCTGILRLWSPRQWMENRDLFTEVSTRL
jgi:hypothetical protein